MIGGYLMIMLVHTPLRKTLMVHMSIPASIPKPDIIGNIIFPNNQTSVNPKNERNNHEKIHLRQQLELLVIPFYLLYLINYIINLVGYKKHYLAYLNICFEREAYRYESDFLYLKKRKKWSFLKFLKKKS